MTSLSKRILIVDDDKSISYTIGINLQIEGYETECASDGFSALSMIKSSRYDLVLLDQVMPGLQGSDVLREIRMVQNKMELPVIFMTSESKSAAQVSALTSGANDYVVKPVSFDVLRARIRSQLDSVDISNSNQADN